MVLLPGYIIQLGSKHVKWDQGNGHNIKEEECTLLALTLYKEDFAADHWLEICEKTIPAIRRILASEDLDILQAIWGRSLRSGRAPANPRQAESAQVHATISTSQVDEFLRKSGYNHVYCTPKLPSGRLSTQFKVLWSSADPAQAKCQATQLHGCLGLVKGKKTIGFRFRSEDFDAAWETLNPGVTIPNANPGSLVFKAMGLPFGVTKSMMQLWCEQYKWSATPFKALGDG